jgi:hypothetical protein
MASLLADIRFGADGVTQRSSSHGMTGSSVLHA